MRAVYYGKRDHQNYEIVGKGTFTTYEAGVQRVYPSVTLKNILTGVLSSTLEVHLNQFFIKLTTDFEGAFSNPERFKLMVDKLGEMYFENDMDSYSKNYTDYVPAVKAAVENHLSLSHENINLVPEEFKQELESFAMSLFVLLQAYEEKKKKSEQQKVDPEVKGPEVPNV